VSARVARAHTLQVVCDDPTADEVRRWLRGTDGAARADITPPCNGSLDAWVDPDGGPGGADDRAVHMDENVTQLVLWNVSASLKVGADYVFLSASLYVDTASGSLAALSLLNAFALAPDAAVATLLVRMHEGVPALRLDTPCDVSDYAEYPRAEPGWATVGLVLDVERDVVGKV
jgi:hypothetical protein